LYCNEQPSSNWENLVEAAIQYINGKRDFAKISYAPLLITKENAAKYYKQAKALF
jgi:ribose transport system substrate-binding protein